MDHALSRDAERMLIQQVQEKNDDEEALDRLTQAHWERICAFAARYEARYSARYGVAPGELRAAAFLGFRNAVMKFNRTYDNALWTYASAIPGPMSAAIEAQVRPERGWATRQSTSQPDEEAQGLQEPHRTWDLLPTMIQAALQYHGDHEGLQWVIVLLLRLMGCTTPEVVEALKTSQAAIAPRWTWLCEQSRVLAQLPHDWAEVYERFQTPPAPALNEANVRQWYRRLGTPVWQQVRLQGKA